MSETLRCATCGEDKPLGAYTHRPGKNGRLYPHKDCKRCRAAKDREERATGDPSAIRHREANRRSWHRHRERYNARKRQLKAVQRLARIGDTGSTEPSS